MGDWPTTSLLVLLPGLDGTGQLFRPLLDVVPSTWRTGVVTYPSSRMCTYDELLGLIDEQVGAEGSVALIAESFSGPLALRYACEHPGVVRAVVLCASFVRPPLPSWLAWFVTPLLFRRAPSTFVVRHFMVGSDASDG